ncbi:MAG: alpha-galactosidase [Myxococcales bacterium]|jgi:hypothetical protein|nr:alpha-galactosidase [Myxococcales bacterium]
MLGRPLACAASIALTWAASGCSPGSIGSVGSDDAAIVDARDAPPLAGDVPSGGPVDLFTSDASSPDAPADVTVSDGPAVIPQPCTPIGNVVSWANGKVRVDYDLAAGTASFFYDGARKVANFYAGVQLATYTTTTMYRTRSCVVRGNQAVVTSTAAGLPTIEQLFVMDGGNKFLARATVIGDGLATNWISPVVMNTPGGVDVGSGGDVRVLQVPFDNDAWVTYDARAITSASASAGTSYEVAAIYDNATRNGIVFGSVTHDTWKTGIFYVGSKGKLDAMNAFGGAADPAWTRDVLPHGKVTGRSIASPTIFVGYAPDWRDLMEEYAAANLAIRPPLAWNGGVPFGWNSWGTLQDKVTYQQAIGVSDFVKGNLQGAGFANEGVVYINLDSYWDNLSGDQLDAFVAHCHANGQKAGIYWTPFVDWGKSATRQVEGSFYVYSDVWLRNGSGQPIELDHAYAIDPTHPGTKARINKFIDEFKMRGFEYVKLDFLTHGSLESSVRFDPEVETGIQAYNQGMQYVVDRIAGTMFISESIAPIFPHGFAHARRVSCDVFGAALGLTSTHYQMNSASYGWWINRHLYRFNDPDQMVFAGFSATDNMSRLVSAVVSGTVFLNGDDLTSATAQALARAYLTNNRINDVARLGTAFRPVEGNTGTDPSSALVLHEGGATYLAVFNFGPAAVMASVDLTRAGLDAATSYDVTDLWSGAASTALGALSARIDAGSARLFALR